MQHGYRCEDCEAAVYPTTTRAKLAWMRDRAHVVREVAKYSDGGLDSWMVEGLAFLNDHSGHSIAIVAKH